MSRGMKTAMTTKSTTRKVTLALIVLAIGGTGCGGCLDREKKKHQESDRPQAGSVEEYSKRVGRRNLASEAFGPDASLGGQAPHTVGEPTGTTR